MQPQQKTPQSTIPQVYSRQQYATKQFWDNRYKQKQSYFDWYAEFPQLKQTFQKQYGMNQSNSILMLGCGNSKLSQQMYESGYKNILNIDISPAVIEQMRKISIEKGYHEMRWEVMDATNMSTIQKQSFDVIIDKGTLDALISGHNIDICVKMLRESIRVLKKDGQFILITYGSPQGRKRFFQQSIGLTLFDYYFTRVDLSSMSTLINLMRSNLGNKPLSSITKDTEAMKKSLVQFNLIKVLRRNRKNQKKYVIWSDFAKSQHGQVESLFENTKDNVKQQNKQIIQVKQVIQSTKTQNPKQQTNPKILYTPKKQSFCYVYSIKHKFANDIEQTTQTQLSPQYSTTNQNGDILIQGDQSLLTFGIYPEPCSQANLIKSINYLKYSQISNNPLIVYKSLQKFIESKQQIKFVLKRGERNTLPVLNKKVLEIEICSGNQSEGSLSNIQNKIKNIVRILVQKNGIQAHPSPKIYAYLGIIMQKLQIKGIRYTQFLERYWYPTYKLISCTSSSSSNLTSTSTSTNQKNKSKLTYKYCYQLALPPSLQQTKCIKIIQQYLSTSSNGPTHTLQSNIKLLRKGYLNYFDPRLIALLNFCSVTFCEGVNLNLIVEEFMGDMGDKGDKGKENSVYSTQLPVVYIRQQVMAKILARILSAM